MKKRMLILLAAALLLTGCTGKNPEEPVQTEPKTKTVFVHSSISYQSGGVTSHTDYHYNEENLLTDVIVSDAQGEQLQHYLVSCDENGNPTEWSSATGSTVTYTYDTQGRTLKTETYTGEALMTATEYTWSGNLRVSTTVRTSSQDQRIEYTYDETGAMLRYDVYESGQLTGYGLFANGEDGKPLLCTYYKQDGNLFNTVTYEYEDGKETRTTADGQGNVLMVNIMTYDEHGNLLKDEDRDSAGGILASEVHEWKAVEVPADTPRASI